MGSTFTALIPPLILFLTIIGNSLCIRVTDILSLFVSMYFIRKEINILVDMGRETESFSWDGRHHLEMADLGEGTKRTPKGRMVVSASHNSFT